jgi:hypothetical protein
VPKLSGPELARARWGTPTIAERFWAKVDTSSSCWLWTAGTDGRYGLFHLDGRSVKAHRVSWELENGPLPAAASVLHFCDVTLCVRPTHLFLGSAADNAHDRDRKGRQRAPRGEASPNAKLTDEAVRAIRASADSDKALAARYGVTPTSIHYVRTGATWRHVA